MISATLMESFSTKFGNGIKVRMADGSERKAYGKGPAPNIAPGTLITFNVTQKGQNYHYDNLRAVGNVTGGWPAPTAAFTPRSPYDGPPLPMATPLMPPKRPEASDKDARMMFVTGVVGRAMSSGQFGIVDVTTLTLAASAAYDALMKRPSERAQERQDEPPPPSEADYGADAPPEW